jgi:Rrf2 family transcriptional regulator, iron-sulfur cluster assembly transcription factor
MHLSTRGRYAIMAMLDLVALAEAGKPVTLAMIAERQQISLSYLEQLFAKLRRGGVVSSVRGPGGGYRLPRAANEIYLAQIIDAVEEDIDLTRCGEMHNPAGPTEGKGCVHGAKCNAHDLWGALGRHMEQFFKQVTLQMVLDGAFTPQFVNGGLQLNSPVRVSIN